MSASNSSSADLAAARRRAVVVAARTGDLAPAVEHLDDEDPRVRASALRAVGSAGSLAAEEARRRLTDPSPLVRRTLAELAATVPAVALAVLLADDDATVVEMAAWAAGEREDAARDLVPALIDLTASHADALVREAAVAALGAIGDPLALDAVLAAMADKATVRRRAVLSLATFDDPRVEAALEAAKNDRDWQVSQAAEDLLDPDLHP